MGSCSIPIHALTRARRGMTAGPVASDLLEAVISAVAFIGLRSKIRAVLTTTLRQRSLRGSRFGRNMTLPVPSPLPKPDQPVGQPGASGSPQHAEHRADNEQLADARARLCV